MSPTSCHCSTPHRSPTTIPDLEDSVKLAYVNPFPCLDDLIYINQSPLHKITDSMVKTANVKDNFRVDSFR